jgi:phosphoesterase RecJ-like protein
MIEEREWKQLKDVIDKGKRIVVASHRNTDGDAIGSLMAMHYYLDSLDKDHFVLTPDPVPAPYHFLDEGDVIEVYAPEKHRERVLGCDTWLCLDLNGAARMADLGDLVEPFEGTIACVDHHLEADHFADLMIGHEEASSTGYLLALFLEYAGIEWTEDLATVVYTAMAADTGNFRYSNTDPGTFRMAAKMVEHGADPSEVYRHLHERWSWGRMQLLYRVLGRLESFADGRLAILSATQEDLRATGCVPVDLEDFVNFGRIIEGVEVSALVCELEPAACKASLRSQGTVDVAEVAQNLGGGGHRNAAGARFDLPLSEALGTLREALVNAIERTLGDKY